MTATRISGPAPDSRRARSGVLLVNLGSPRAPTPASVSSFLAEFLSDRRVVELPALLWRPLLRAVVIPLRARRVAHAYASIWDGDSPLRRISERQRELVQAELDATLGERAPRVRLAMTYQGPSIQQELRAMLAEGIERICVLPLYPQYSATTTAAVFDRVSSCLQGERRLPHLALVRDYHDRPGYIEALAASVREHWQQRGRAAHLLVSFHGIPQANIERGDPYAGQCERTAALLVEALGLDAAGWSLAWQSRFGRARWLEPSTDAVLARLATSGIRSVDVVCPSFASDCLETLEEIAVASRARFVAAGGSELCTVPCLNTRVDHVRMLGEIARAHC